MLTSAFLLTLLATTNLRSGIPPSQDATGPSENTFAVVMHFEQEISAETLKQAQHELEYIMLPLGFRFDWRFAGHKHAGDAANYFVSVYFAGNCLIPEIPRRAEHSNVLAQTAISDGRILPYCQVNCDSVQDNIHYALISHTFVQMRYLLGRALGRVLAHEFYHILADTRQHGDEGLAKPVLKTMDLVEGLLKLDPDEVDEIRHKLGRSPSVPTPHWGALRSSYFLLDDISHSRESGAPWPAR